MERPQALEQNQHALDSVYFSGSNGEGVYFVMRIGRRQERVCELWLSAFIPEVGFLQSPLHPDSRVVNTDGQTFSAGGLKFECLEPMRRWKINFNGILRKGLRKKRDGNKADEMVHVKFSFIWEAFTEKFDFDTDMSDWLLADALAREMWSNEFWSRLKSIHQTHYEQFGETRGELQIEGNQKLKIMIRGLRDHTYGIRDWSTFHRYIVHIGHLQDGTVFHVSNVSIPLTTSFLRCGFMVMPCGRNHPVTWTDLDLSAIGEDGDLPDYYEFSFTAGDKTHHVCVDIEHRPHYYMQEDGCSQVQEGMCKFTVNGVKGQGITESCYRFSKGNSLPTRKLVTSLGQPDTVAEEDLLYLTFAFRETPCRSSILVGGKGCQLAILSQMEGQDFIIPNGFCLTIQAFNMHLQNHKELQTAVGILEAVVSGRKSGNVEETCGLTVEKFLKTPICEKIKEALVSSLQSLFTDFSAKSFAVRSSAIGEDGVEISGAGQMETILGVKGMEMILEAIRKCWGSHFAFQAVEYRRQHGQAILSSMGVVIQEMVPSQISGVLFTMDPLTSNPGFISINANYGLGESVVLGASDPDTITVSRSLDDKINIVKKEIGKKQTKISIQDNGGTQESAVSDSLSSLCSLSDEIILRLAHIGIELEKGFSIPQDVEWAVYENRIYLLQTRPITSLYHESEWEMMHEFDTPLASEKECMSTANIGEMMPGAMTPLTQSVFFRAIEYGFQDILRNIGIIQKPPNLHKFLGISHGRPFINLTYLHGLCEGNVLGNDKRMADLALMGEVQEQLTPEMVAAYWGTSSFFKKIIHGIRNFLNMRASVGRTRGWEDAMAKNYSLGEHKTAASLYESIQDHMDDLYKCWADTFTNSSRSGAWSTILMAILSQGKTDWKTQYYSDVAMLLAKCDDVYSADVPKALQEMAVSIGKSGQRDKFVKLSAEEAVWWLQMPASGEVGFKFGNFLRSHGHRCVREADFYEKSWRSDQVKVVKVLQAMLATPEPPSLERRTQDSIDEAIKQIKSPTTTFGRLVLRWALPKARKAVGAREWGKSISIQFHDIFKQAYWKLAELMVSEGFLPEKELIFFLTNTEILKILKERPSRLIPKAQRRRLLLEKQTLLQFPRINWGHPQPIVEDEPEERNITTSIKVQGMPVSQGSVKGTARVILSLSSAHEIKPGDILVVRATDVGWSPYFPIISGLVTEIGGLLSHGAVVAREYGLPCVVNVRRATSKFTSGDKVYLDGFKGTLEKLGQK